MSEHIGGKGSGASSSSEFLRAYRAGVLAGANASYQTIPKKAAKSYTTAADLLEAQNQRGVLADLSSVIVTKSTCPVVNTPQHQPLEYVSTNLFSSIPNESRCIIYVNTGDLYYTPLFSPGMYAVKPFRQVLDIGGGYILYMMQSMIDGKVYIVTYNGGFLSLVSYTIGGIGYTTLISNILPPSIYGITQDNLGNFYITAGYGEIYSIKPPYSSASMIGMVSGQYLSGITYASDGNLYVVTMYGGKVYRFSTAGVGQLLCNTGIVTQRGIIQANDGNLYICGDRKVVRVTLAGVVTDFATFEPYATGITQGANENLYITTTSALSGNVLIANVYQIVVR